MADSSSPSNPRLYRPPSLLKARSSSGFLGPVVSFPSSAPMADKENSTRVTRSTVRKRAHDSAPLVTCEAAKRPRVVLGELCNLADPSSRPQDDPCKPKPRARRKKPSDAPKIEEAEKPLGVLDIDFGSDDPQLCPQYALDIHQYFRSMEVSPADLNSWIRFIVSLSP